MLLCISAVSLSHIQSYNRIKSLPSYTYRKPLGPHSPGIDEACLLPGLLSSFPVFHISLDKGHLVVPSYSRSRRQGSFSIASTRWCFLPFLAFFFNLQMYLSVPIIYWVSSVVNTQFGLYLPIFSSFLLIRLFQKF